MNSDTPQCSCRVGVASCDITPPVGIYHRMWGAATHDRAEGVHRTLSAAALAFGSAAHPQQPPQVLITLDHCLLFHREMKELRERVAAETGIAPERLTITFSHTHAAGLMDRDRGDMPGGDLIGPYLDGLAASVATIVRDAVGRLGPAIMVYGMGRCDLARHRDYFDAAAGQYVCGFNPAESADDTVLVARITRPTGEIVATIVNYACHPTTLAWENRLISPDYIGAMREVVEHATAAPCMFLQGASGDLGPRDGYVGDTTTADRNGRQLGYAALAALEGLPPPATTHEYTGAVVSGATLGTWRHRPLTTEELDNRSSFTWRRFTVNLPYRADLPNRDTTAAELQRWTDKEVAAQSRGDAAAARDARALAERMRRQLTKLAGLPAGSTFPFPVLLGQLGDAIWVAVEGEAYSLLQTSLRAKFAPTPIVVITLADGWRPAYLPTADAYGHGIYQETVAVLARGALESLIDAVAAEVSALLRTGAP